MKVKTRIMASTMAALVLCANLSAFAESKAYSDVTEQSPYYDAITSMTENGVFTGVSETEFAPDESLTRGMFVTLLNRVYNNLHGGESELENTDLKSSFTDVNASDYFCAAVIWAQENGIVTGYSDEIFAPNDVLTKEQAITILCRFSNYSKDEFLTGDDTNILSYEDYDEISKYAIPSIQWALENGIISEDGTKINAGEVVTRGSAAQYLYNYTEKWFNSRGDREVTE